MKRLQKPPVKEVKTSKKEPLAEGLQIVPRDSRERRIWKTMSDAQIVTLARKVMKENEVSGRKELSKVDYSLYQVLVKRGLLDELGLEMKCRSWSKMSNEEIVEIARKVMKEKGITKRSELQKVDPGIYITLAKRDILDRIGFEERKRSWNDISDDKVVELARKVMNEEKIRSGSELSEVDGGLYQVLKKRKLVHKIGFETKRRSWKSMSDEEIVGLAREVIEKEGIKRKGELSDVDSGLYKVLRERKLLDELGFEKKYKKQRSWRGISDDEVVKIARKLMEEKGINSRGELTSLDEGLYAILYRRKLLDRAFAHIKQQRTKEARDAVIDALTEFANSEKPEVGIA